MQGQPYKIDQEDQYKQEMSNFPENVQLLGNRYSLYLQQKQKIMQTQNNCSQKLKTNLYRSLQCLWKSAIPEFIRQPPTQYTHFLSTLKQSSKKTHHHTYSELFYKKSLEKVVKCDKSCVVLLYEQKNVDDIDKLVVNQKLCKLTQKLDRKLCLLEVNQQRNKEWTDKLNEVKSECGFPNQDSNILQILPNNKSNEKKNVTQVRQKLRRKFKHNLPTRFKDKQLSNKKIMEIPYSSTTSNQSKNETLVSIQQQQNNNLKVFEYPLIVSIWKGFYDEIILLDWFPLKRNSQSLFEIGNILQQKFKAQQNLQRQICRYVEIKQKRMILDRIFQTQKSLLNTQ